MKKYALYALFLLCGLMILFVYQTIRFNDGKLHIVFCDVGQGDGIFIRTSEGLDIVIDGGPDESILSCLSNNMPFWDKKIDLMVLTHPHADHMNGLAVLAKRYTVSRFATQMTFLSSPTFKELNRVLQIQKTKIQSLCQNDTLIIKNTLKLVTLWPQECTSDLTQLNDPNNQSVVELLSYRNFQILLTGDITADIADKVGRKAGVVEVIKVPHHGSRTGMDTTFLKNTQPRYAIISAGKNNRYGHPAKETINLLRENAIKTLRTDTTGDIEITSDGTTFTLQKK